MRNAVIAAVFGMLGCVLCLSMLGSMQAQAAGNRISRQNYQTAGGGTFTGGTVADPVTLNSDLTLASVDIICAVSNACNLGQTTRFNSIFTSDLFSDRIQQRATAQPVRITELDGLEITGETTFLDKLNATGADPVLSACGTSPTVVGADSFGQVTIGTGVTTSCTATFDSAFGVAPSCTLTGDNTALGYAVTTTTTVMTITSSADMASDVINYTCVGL